MAATWTTDTVSSMPDTQGGQRGARIRARREQFGWDRKSLAARAGVGRDTLARVESDGDGVRPITYAQVERALDDLAAELGFDEAEAGGHLVRYEVRLPGAVSVTVSGTVDDIEELEASVERILASRRADAAGVEGS